MDLVWVEKDERTEYVGREWIETSPPAKERSGTSVSGAERASDDAEREEELTREADQRIEFLDDGELVDRLLREIVMARDELSARGRCNVQAGSASSALSPDGRTSLRLTTVSLGSEIKDEERALVCADDDPVRCEFGPSGVRGVST